MFPYFTIFGKTIYMYTLFAVIGLLTAGFFVCHQVSKKRNDSNEAIVLMLVTAIGIFFGGHILYGITNISFVPQIFSSKDFFEFINNFALVFGGSVFYGGLIGGIIAAIIWIKVKKLDLTFYGDIFAPAVPLFHSIARIGCFFGGCCYGIPSSFGFVAHNNTLVPELNDVSRFPVQLLESALNLILFFVLWYCLSKQKLKGKLLLLYLTIYPIIRFFDEFLRGDKIRGFIFGLSTSRFISIIIFTIAVVGMIIVCVKKEYTPEKKAD